MNMAFLKSRPKLCLIAAMFAVYLVGRPGGEPYAPPPPSPETAAWLERKRATAERDARAERIVADQERIEARLKEQARR